MSLRNLRDRWAGTAGTRPVPAPVPTPDPLKPKQDAGSGALGPLGPLGHEKTGNPEVEAVDDGALADLYRALFAGHEARALVTLEPAHVRRAVAARAVTLEVAQASVLVAYRNGEARCLMAVPRERYDGLGVLEAFGAAT